MVYSALLRDETWALVGGALVEGEIVRTFVLADNRETVDDFMWRGGAEASEA